MVTATRKEKAHRLLKNNEPMLDVINYDISMIHALNYYNINHDNKEKKKWMQAHFGKKIKFSLDIPDYNFKIIGTLCRILDNGNVLSDAHEKRIQSEFDMIKSLSDKIKPVVVATNTKPVATIQEKMDAKVSEFLAEFAGLVDEFVLTGSHPKVDSLINSMNIRGPMTKKVIARVEGTIEELKEALAGTDKQLTEGYSQFKKTELKKLLGIYESLVSSLGQAKVLTVRKTRTVKAKPAVVIVKNIKYMKEDTALGLKSVEPATIVGAEEVWVFNTKYKTMQFYEAAPGSNISVKGTTLTGFNTEKSLVKKVRKPEAIASLNSLGKRAYTKFFKELKTATSACNGRINDQCVILATFR